MVEKIRMNVNDTLELDYLVEKVSRNAIDVANEPNNVSTSIDYISTETGIFDPPDTGTYQLNINGQTIEIEVNDIPDSVVLLPENDDLTHFVGDTGSFAVDDTSPVLPVDNNNDLSLKSSGTGARVIGSNSGLPNYPTTGVEIELSVYVDHSNSTAIGIYYNCSGIDPQNTDSGYGIGVRPDNSDIGIFRRDSGNFVSIDIQNYDWNDGWYTFNVTHNGDGSISWSATEVNSSTTVASGSPTDSAHITNGAFDYSYVTYRVVSDTPTLDLWYQPNA